MYIALPETVDNATLWLDAIVERETIKLLCLNNSQLECIYHCINLCISLNTSIKVTMRREWLMNTNPSNSL